MTSQLRVLSPREASIFACLTDTVAAPEPVLPAVRGTTAIAFFDDWLARSPRLNALALRGLLYAAELAPRLLGFGARLRALPPAERGRALEAAEAVRRQPLPQLVDLIRGVVLLSYYGDDGVMRRLGYDADAVIERGRAVRRRDGRP